MVAEGSGRKSGKTYMFAENYCYMPFVQIVKAMAAQGLFGDVYYGEDTCTPFPARARYPDGSASWRTWWQLGDAAHFTPRIRWGGDAMVWQ